MDTHSAVLSKELFGERNYSLDRVRTSMWRDEVSTTCVSRAEIQNMLAGSTMYDFLQRNPDRLYSTKNQMRAPEAKENAAMCCRGILRLDLTRLSI